MNKIYTKKRNPAAIIKDIAQNSRIGDSIINAKIIPIRANNIIAIPTNIKTFTPLLLMISSRKYQIDVKIVCFIILLFTIILCHLDKRTVYLLLQIHYSSICIYLYNDSACNHLL